MSGPVETGQAGADTDTGPVLRLQPSHEAEVGPMTVRRALPRRGHRTVGAWCFADHMGPLAVTEEDGVEIGPHPHIGLQTVTWLLAGEFLHRDSLGSEQLIRPGQLNLMTAGHGVAHAEEATGRYRGSLHGIQLWVAQPEATRHGAAAFEHHAELPQVELDRASATVLVGDFATVRSTARADTDHVGVDLHLRPGTTVAPLAAEHEHALVVLSGEVAVEGRAVGPGVLAYLGRGRDELALTVREDTRAVLLGGSPFESEILMWWNFVARTRDEVRAAQTAWNAEEGRFGPTGSGLSRIPAPGLPWS